MEFPPEYPKKISRISAVLILMGSLIWVQWPIDFEKFNTASLVVFIASFLAWLGIEAADLSSSNSINNKKIDRDIEKLNKILEMIDRNQSHTIKMRDIETYIGVDEYEGLKRNLRYCEDDKFPFYDQKTQIAYNAFCQSSEVFLLELSRVYTFDGRNSITWRPRGGGYVSESEYERIMVEVSNLRKLKNNLSEIWDEFIETARVQLSGGSKSINIYDF